MLVTLEIIYLWAIASIIHVTALSAAVCAARIPIREISYGFGWQLSQFGLIRLRALPFGGYVTMKHSREDELPPEECDDAFDCQPIWIRVAIPLTGCFITLGTGMLFLGTPGWAAFLDGFSQVFEGSLAPLTTAQVLIGKFIDFLGEQDFFTALGLCCVKIAAFNLLPFPLLNGGEAVLTLTRMRKWSPALELWLRQFSLTLLLLVFGSWLTAVAVYVWRILA